jgi:tetratricopeptide (TPR) repeat protein
MYHMNYGIALYWAVIDEAKKRQARAEGKDPTEIRGENLDLKGANFDPALGELETAVKLNGDLFRAYYYLGRIHRHNDDAQKAAEAFTKSIEANPRFAQPNIPLRELYRRWDYSDEAVKVLSQGKANVPGDKDRSELLFSLGMAYDDKKDFAKAVEEFTATLESDKNMHAARYQRGMAYVRLKEWQKARQDLEQFQKNAKDDFTKSVAQKALMDIMAALN